ncbi:MAG: hypothetical protein P8R54_31060 [Myxococcota bacterium]|nr:hypothetical protein [Myxococcota bacterium]
MILALLAAAHARCADLPVRSALTCSSVIQDELTDETPNRLTGPYVCPKELHQRGGEHIYSFRCQQSGPVNLLISDLECDLDIYVLDDTCDTRRGCVGESVAASNASDRVRFDCRAGQQYFIAIEGYGFQGFIGRCGRRNSSGRYTLQFDVSDVTGGCQEHCSDGADNDNDGQIDCDDTDCTSEESCLMLSGLTLDTSGLPTSCAVGADCAGTVALRLPDGPQKVRWQAALADPATAITLNGVPMPRQSGAHYTARRSGQNPTTETWTIAVTPADGEAITALHTVSYFSPLRLVVPQQLDFGTLPAGSSTFGPQHCQTLDLSASQNLDQHLFDLTFGEPDGGCEAEPVLRAGSQRRPRPSRLPLEGIALSETLELCLSVPACAGDSGSGASLHITPRTAAYADQAATVTLDWTVTERSWLSCNWWWLAILSSIAFTLWVIAGFIRPHRFAREAGIQIAGSEKGLRRAAPQLLREFRGARAGFYRDAALGVHADGSVNGRLKGSIVQLHATRQGVVLKGAVELQDRRTRRWATPEDLIEGHLPSPAATYRAGDLWFKVEV